MSGRGESCFTCARSLAVTGIMCCLACEQHNVFWISRVKGKLTDKTVCRDCEKERHSACECKGKNGVPDCCSIYNERHPQEVVVTSSRFYTTERNDEQKEIRPVIVWEE